MNKFKEFLKDGWQPSVIWLIGTALLLYFTYKAIQNIF